MDPKFQRAVLAHSILKDEFERFHKENPDVYDTLKKLALEWKTRGKRKLGIKMLYERARWEFALQTTGDRYNLCNNHTAFYSRLLMEREPELRGLFNLRRQRHEFEVPFASTGQLSST